MLARRNEALRAETRRKRNNEGRMSRKRSNSGCRTRGGTVRGRPLSQSPRKFPLRDSHKHLLDCRFYEQALASESFFPRVACRARGSQRAEKFSQMVDNLPHATTVPCSEALRGAQREPLLPASHLLTAKFPKAERSARHRRQTIRADNATSHGEPLNPKH